MVITVYVGLRWGREYMKMAQTSKSRSYTACLVVGDFDEEDDASE